MKEIQTSLEALFLTIQGNCKDIDIQQVDKQKPFEIIQDATVQSIDFAEYFMKPEPGCSLPKFEIREILINQNRIAQLNNLLSIDQTSKILKIDTSEDHQSGNYTITLRGSTTHFLDV